MAEERGLIVDVEGFNSAMDEARERSRSAQNKVSSACPLLYVVHNGLKSSKVIGNRLRNNRVLLRRFIHLFLLFGGFVFSISGINTVKILEMN